MNKTNPQADITYLENDNREYVVFKNYDHLIACVDHRKDFASQAVRGANTSYKVDGHKHHFTKAVNGSEGNWAYGKEGHEAYIARTLSRMPHPEVLDASRKDLNKKLKTKEVMRLRQRMMSRRKRRFYSDTDGIMSIPRILSGSDKYFIKRQKKQLVGMKIGIKGGLTCNFDETAFLDLISGLIITAKMLEFVGIPTELHYIGDSQNLASGAGFTRQGIIFPIKRGFERINLKKVCMIGSSGHFRHHIFGAWALYNSGDLNSGLGQQTDTEYEEDCKLLNLDIILGKEFMGNNPVDVFNYVTKGVFS